jgi:hypothetical protein
MNYFYVNVPSKNNFKKCNLYTILIATEENSRTRDLIFSGPVFGILVQIRTNVDFYVSINPDPYTEKSSVSDSY